MDWIKPCIPTRLVSTSIIDVDSLLESSCQYIHSSPLLKPNYSVKKNEKKYFYFLIFQVAAAKREADSQKSVTSNGVKKELSNGHATSNGFSNSNGQSKSNGSAKTSKPQSSFFGGFANICQMDHALLYENDPVSSEGEEEVRSVRRKIVKTWFFRDREHGQFLKFGVGFKSFFVTNDKWFTAVYQGKTGSPWYLWNDRYL